MAVLRLAADTFPMATARSTAWLRPALLAAAVVVVYAPALRAPFVFDDEAAVIGNPTIRELWSPDILRPPADGGTTTGRPLVNARGATREVHPFNWMGRLMLPEGVCAGTTSLRD